MWSGLVVRLLAQPWARRGVAITLVALTILLMIINRRRAGEHAGSATERLD